MDNLAIVHWIDKCTIVALLLPLLSSIVATVVPKQYAWLITVLSPLILLISALASLMVFLSWTPHQSPMYIPMEWFHVGDIHFSAGIELTDHSVMMLTIVTIVSFLVHFYSTGYMAGDHAVSRYFAMLGFFTFSMLGIVLSDNLLLIFFFWELVGFSSYMLIGHWTEKPAAGAAASKAFILNRIGDAGFLIALMIIWTNTKTFSFAALQAHGDFGTWQTAASLCLFCGVAGKSAQLPLFTWLPDAMEGPTPVSALIHAATMVAAGVYLLVKCFFLLSADALNVIAVIGAMTSILAAVSATVQFDIKKILAYSTISQLGMMVLAIGTGSRDAAMLHLVTHAFFKAGLFLSAGAVIHALHQTQHESHHSFDVQDIRNMGGLRKHLPVTSLACMLCAAALSGVPLFSGFLSKDAILMGVWAWKGDVFSWRWLIVIIAFIIPFVTVVYTFRFVWYIFFGENRTARVVGKPVVINEVPAVMRLPLIFLAAMSLWFIVNINPVEYAGWLFHYVHEGAYVHIPLITAFSALLVVTGWTFSFFYFKSRTLDSGETTLQVWIMQSFYLDRLYEGIVLRPVRKLTTVAEKIDLKWIDGCIHAGVYAQVTFAHAIGWVDRYIVNGSVHGVARFAGGLGSFTRSFQGGKVQLYIFWTTLAIIIFLIWMLK